MRSLRWTFAALVLLACGPKQPTSEPKPEPTDEQRPPKPNIDPGRVPSQKLKLPPPETKPSPFSLFFLRMWPTATAGCRWPAPVSMSS